VEEFVQTEEECHGVGSLEYNVPVVHHGEYTFLQPFVTMDISGETECVDQFWNMEFFGN